MNATIQSELTKRCRQTASSELGIQVIWCICMLKTGLSNVGEA